MKSKFVIGTMTIVWLVLMAGIVWQGTDGKWHIEDAEKIGKLEVAKYTNQIIVVAAEGQEAMLCFYQKESAGDWQLVLETEALIGENGLGKRKEGDKKTPTGIYQFTKAFGILENPDTKMEYTQVNGNNYWVDDARSKYYNKFISMNEVVQDWTSAEHICEYGEAYHYVLATSYNISGIPGAGSAVFLHCTDENMESTAGCVAVPEIYMKQIIQSVMPQCVLIIDTVDNISKY